MKVATRTCNESLLTKLDQTDVKFFNPENFFNAEDLTT